MSVTLLSLPLEILEHIASYLNASEKLNVLMCSEYLQCMLENSGRCFREISAFRDFTFNRTHIRSLADLPQSMWVTHFNCNGVYWVKKDQMYDGIIKLVNLNELFALGTKLEVFDMSQILVRVRKVTRLGMPGAKNLPQLLFIRKTLKEYQSLKYLHIFENGDLHYCILKFVLELLIECPNLEEFRLSMVVCHQEHFMTFLPLLIRLVDSKVKTVIYIYNGFSNLLHSPIEERVDLVSNGVNQILKIDASNEITSDQLSATRAPFVRSPDHGGHLNKILLHPHPDLLQKLSVCDCIFPPTQAPAASTQESHVGARKRRRIVQKSQDVLETLTTKFPNIEVLEITPHDRAPAKSLQQISFASLANWSSLKKLSLIHLNLMDGRSLQDGLPYCTNLESVLIHLDTRVDVTTPFLIKGLRSAEKLKDFSYSLTSVIININGLLDMLADCPSIQRVHIGGTSVQKLSVKPLHKLMEIDRLIYLVLTLAQFPHSRCKEVKADMKRFTRGKPHKVYGLHAGPIRIGEIPLIHLDMIYAQTYVCGFANLCE